MSSHDRLGMEWNRLYLDDIYAQRPKNQATNGNEPNSNAAFLANGRGGDHVILWFYWLRLIFTNINGRLRLKEWAQAFMRFAS